MITTPLFVNGTPRWSPKGDLMLFQSDRSGIQNLYLKRMSGGQEEELLTNNYYKLPTQLSADGRFVVYTQTDPGTRPKTFFIESVAPAQ